MELNDDTWHVVKETPKVTGFVGGSTNPPPVSDEEVRTITQQMEEGAIKPKPRVLFSVGENVKVVDGPFADFNGVVEEVKPDKGKLRVLISIFGRATPVGWNLFRWSGTKQKVKHHGEEGYRRDQTSDTGGPSESKPARWPGFGSAGCQYHGVLQILQPLQPNLSGE